MGHLPFPRLRFLIFVPAMCCVRPLSYPPSAIWRRAVGLFSPLLRGESSWGKKDVLFHVWTLLPCTPALSSLCNFFSSEHTSSFLPSWYFYALAGLFFEQIALGGDVGMGEPPQIKTSVFCLTVASTLSNMT